MTACLFATCPTSRSPSFVKATTEGVVRAPSEFSITLGCPPSTIATQLFVTEHTVNFHVRNILAKLHLKNRTQAVAYAIRSGLVSNPPPGD